MTDSTPPCRMLSVMFISLVCPYLVFNRARRLLFNSLAIFHIGNSVPSLCMMYRMASSQALSYAFVTSRNAMYAGFLLFLMVWMVSFSRVRWSTVALPFCPPA